MLKKLIIEKRAFIKESFGRKYIIAAFSSCNYYGNTTINGIVITHMNNEEGD